jgi:hypothetical protein
MIICHLIKRGREYRKMSVQKVQVLIYQIFLIKLGNTFLLLIDQWLLRKLIYKKVQVAFEVKMAENT